MRRWGSHHKDASKKHNRFSLEWDRRYGSNPGATPGWPQCEEKRRKNGEEKLAVKCRRCLVGRKTSEKSLVEDQQIILRGDGDLWSRRADGWGNKKVLVFYQAKTPRASSCLCLPYAVNYMKHPLRVVPAVGNPAYGTGPTLRKSKGLLKTQTVVRTKRPANSLA